MKLSALIDESRVVLGLSGSAAKDDIIKHLTSVALAGNSVPSQPLIDDLCKREKLMSTGIGQGVAIPHTHTPAIAKPYSALGISTDGIAWDAVDGEPVHIVFLLITPDSQPLLHVQTLGEMAALFGSEDTRREVISSRSPKELIDAIRRSEK